jgi:DHA2 family multidrug resistance protein
MNASPGRSAHDQASTADWIAVLAGALGALLATLDTSIVNSALPTIQGEIGATGTEGTWISTGYLVSEVVIIPLTAWLTRVMGMRTLLLCCGILFSLFSTVCGLSGSLVVMILGRVGQGFVGGALIPTAQTIVRTRLPEKQQPLGMSLFGVIVIMGPLVGPVVGGWLTETVSWRWCFFLNLPVTIALITLLLLGLPHEKPRPDLLARADWGGIIGLTVFLSCLTVVLEEGQRERWFESDLICWLTAVGFLGFVTLMITQATVEDPVVKLRLLLNKSYASVIVFVVAVGAGLYGLTYILPQFLNGIAGYNAEQSGEVLILSGIPALILMPILPRLMGKLDLRVMVTIGLLCFSAACFTNIHLNALDAGSRFYLSQILTGTGMLMAMMPLNQASVGAVGREHAADAAGLYNMARNLGGSSGLAALGIFIDRRTEFHADIIRESVNANAPLVQERIAGMAASFMQAGTDPAYAQMQALSQLSVQIHIQALVMTYADCFWLSGAVLIGIIPLVLLLRKPPPTAEPAAGVH